MEIVAIAMLSFQVKNQQDHSILTAIILKKMCFPLDALRHDFDGEFEIHSTIGFLLKRLNYACQFEIKL